MFRFEDRGLEFRLWEFHEFWGAEVMEFGFQGFRGCVKSKSSGSKLWAVESTAETLAFHGFPLRTCRSPFFSHP